MSTSSIFSNGNNSNSFGKILLFRRRRRKFFQEVKSHYPIDEGLEITSLALTIFQRKILPRQATNGGRKRIKKLSFRLVIPKIRRVWSEAKEIGHSSEGGDIYVAKQTEWGDVYFVTRKSNKNNGALVIVTILDGRTKAKNLMAPKEVGSNKMRQAFKFR
ncbi:MAG: hypothetical protein PHD51_02805 [Patescibacteria group bacterium]|nr:hypothetical protein [Patescibacteria group bacterium]MDD5490215.1 hypothetical protein [Patescibacteria group bacterium]